MSIVPLPVFEDELRAYQEDQRAYAALRAPRTMVVRFGFMRMVGEFPYQGEEKPGCGSKIVVRTHRGTEIGEMLTSTCPNAGCSKSVTRKQMLEYIQNSGGRDYPFFEHGRALRVATAQDMREQERIEHSKHPMRLWARSAAARAGFGAKIVEVEPILGHEQVTVYFHSEERMDFRELASALQKEWGTRVEMRQVGARDEARLTADYERCGQHCCCKNFLKVLKPVSMRSAKVQKATLDPLKISGRCGRLMCCLRYEDQTYEDLRKRLPRNKSRVGTPDGDGTVIDSQILTQLVLVRLDAQGREVAVAVEDLAEPVRKEAPEPFETRPPERGERPRRDQAPSVGPGEGPRDRARRRRDERGPAPEARRRDGTPARAERRPEGPAAPPESIGLDDIETDFGDGPGDGPGGRPGGGPGGSGPDGQPGKRKRRRRRRRGGGGESGGTSGGDGGSAGGA